MITNFVPMNARYEKSSEFYIVFVFFFGSFLVPGGTFRGTLRKIGEKSEKNPREIQEEFKRNPRRIQEKSKKNPRLIQEKSKKNPRKIQD